MIKNMIKNFDEFLNETKKLHNLGIPEDVFSSLFKRKLLRDNDVDMTPLKTKKEVKERLIKHEDILAFDEENHDYVYIIDRSYNNYHAFFRKEDHESSETGIISKMIKFIDTKYIYFSIHNNRFSDKTIDRERRLSDDNIISKEISLTDAQTKFLVKKLKELKEDTVKKLTKEATEYRSYITIDDDENPSNMLASISMMNEYIDIIENGKYYSGMSIAPEVHVFSRISHYLKEYIDKTTPIEKAVEKQLAKMTTYWRWDDFNGGLGRKIITKKEQEQINLDKKIDEYDV